MRQSNHYDKKVKFFNDAYIFNVNMNHMSDAPSEQIEETTVTAEDVLAFLKANPKFIKELYSKQDALSTNISHVKNAINLHIEQSKVITRAKDIMNTMEV